ncbi:MAG: hypothetical protein HY905_26600 [Deltaproteobacteria bacterium]|nr:hypothetical protein [Deltaproteobacteria bacterium]
MKTTISLLLSFLGACRTTGSPTASSPTETADSSATRPDTSESVAAPLPDSSTRVRLEASAAEEHGLPAIGFSVDTAGTPMLALPFPDQDEYLAVSGPPGGPQIVRVQTLPEPPADGAALEPLLRERFAYPGSEPLVFGAPTLVTLAGAQRPALSLVTGTSMARTGWCAVAVAVGPAGSPGLLVLAGIGTQGDPDCAAPLADDSLARVLGTLRIEGAQAAASPAPERHWRVFDGDNPLLEISNVPGVLMDTSAPPPPPGSTPSMHPFLSAACGGDPLACSRAGDLLRASSSLDEFLDSLRNNGYRVEELTPAP